MTEEPNGRGLAWLLAAKLVCCGGLLLVATGVLSLGSLMGWFLEGGYVWLGITAFALAMLWLWRRRRAEQSHSVQQNRGSASRGAT